MSRFLALTDSDEFGQHLSAALLPAHGLELLSAHGFELLSATEAGTAADVLGRNSGPAQDVVIFGPDLDASKVLALAAGFDRLAAEIVAVWAATPPPELMLAAMRAGMRDILAPETPTPALRLALEQAASTAAAARKPSASGSNEQQRTRGRVISVMSPKGGVGKTTVATNLAVGLAKIAPMGAVIVDLDLQFGDVATGLGLEPSYTITDAVGAAASTDAMVLKAYLSSHPSGLYAMCAPLLPSEADFIKPAQISTLVSQLSLEFPYVILDTSPGLGEEVLAVLELATDGVWVCGMDIPSIRGLKLGLDVLRQLDLMPPANTIVLNFANKRSGLSVRDVEETVGLPVDIVLPHSKTLPFSTNTGVPLLQENRKDPATRGLKKLVERLNGTLTNDTKKNHRRAEVL